MCGERAAAIGVFDAVEVGGGRVGDAGRKVNTADEADRAGRERRLIVAEVGAGASKSDREIVDADGSAEIPDVGGARRDACFVVNSENCAAAIDDGDGHGVYIDGSCGGLDEIGNIGSA